MTLQPNIWHSAISMSTTHSPINPCMLQSLEQETNMLLLPETNFISFPSSPPLNKSSIADIQPSMSLDTSSDNSQQSGAISVASAIVKMLEDLGVQYAFGVSGGAIAPIWHTLQHSSIKLRHFRHEAGAAFAATEAYFANTSMDVFLMAQCG